jgi:thiol-disulfide isomerase/thioredoxin
MKRIVLWGLVVLIVAGCNKSASNSGDNSPQSDVPAPSNVNPKSPVPKADTPVAAEDASAAAAFVAQAEQKLRINDLAGALQLLQQAIAKDQRNTRALLLAVQVTQQQGMQLAKTDAVAGYALFKKSAGYMRTLKKLDNRDAYKTLESQAYYNEACALAREGKKDEAIASLNECLAVGGFTDVGLFDTDEDLVSLRDMPAFKSLVPKFKENLLTLAKEKAKAEMKGTPSFYFDFKLPALDGKTISLSDYSGKVVIVDFWGTWCPPCRAEIPHFIALHNKYRDKGLEIVGINYERVPEAKVRETIKGFVDSQGITYPCVIGDKTTQGYVPKFEGYPTTLFIDRTGKVRAKIVGLHSMADLEALIIALLEEPAAPAKP